MAKKNEKRTKDKVTSPLDIQNSGSVTIMLGQWIDGEGRLNTSYKTTGRTNEEIIIKPGTCGR